MAVYQQLTISDVKQNIKTTTQQTLKAPQQILTLIATTKLIECFLCCGVTLLQMAAIFFSAILDVNWANLTKLLEICKRNSLLTFVKPLFNLFHDGFDTGSVGAELSVEERKCIVSWTGNFLYRHGQQKCVSYLIQIVLCPSNLI